jgi:hypothetical protein
VPSLHCAVAPAALLFSPELAERRAGLGAPWGFGAGATVVRGRDDALLVRHAARIRLYHFVQSVVEDVVVVVVFTAPGDRPEGVCAPADRHAALLAFPRLVQS